MHQTSECIRLIQTNTKLPIQRARMRIKISLPTTVEDEEVRTKIRESAEKVEEEINGANEWEVVR